MARSARLSLFRGFTTLLFAVGCLAALGPPPARAQQAEAQAPRDDYVLGAGDAIRIQVFQSPELTVDARVSEAGVISYPLLGPVRIGGMSSTDIEKLIAQRLRDGKFLQNPQVTVNITTFRSQQVSVLGNVTRPGRYPLETTGMRLSEVLSLAGGVTAAGADEVVLVTTRDGKETRIEIDMVDMFASGSRSKDLQMHAGDVIYVSRAPQYYIYGQVQRPGMYGVDRGMTVAQAIAKGGGLTLRGTDKGVRVSRRKSDGKLDAIEPRLDDPIRPDDLIFIRESIF